MKKDFAKLIPGAVLCEVPEDISDILGNHFKRIVKTKPGIHEGDYKQWFMQSCLKIGKLRSHDTNFTEWLDHGQLDLAKSFFLKYVDGVYRFRYSTMPPTHKIDYHMPHLYPRIHIPLNEAKSFFTIETKEKTYEFVLEKGYAYILNVVYPHTVTSDLFREHCFFSFTDFANQELKSKYWLD